MPSVHDNSSACASVCFYNIDAISATPEPRSVTSVGAKPGAAADPAAPEFSSSPETDAACATAGQQISCAPRWLRPPHRARSECGWRG